MEKSSADIKRSRLRFVFQLESLTVALLRIVMGNLKRNDLYPHSKQNENKTHTNPLISLVLPGNFQFFKSTCLHTSCLSPRQCFLLRMNFKFILQGEISPLPSQSLKSLNLWLLSAWFLYLFPVKQDMM